MFSSVISPRRRPKSWNRSSKSLAKQGMKSLILDLRDNAGGPLFQAIGVADQFLPKGAAIVSVRGRNSIFDRRFPATRDNPYEKIPLIVLISQGSASASEIVAGAVMDHDRGLVIGEDSWGKSLVQQMFRLSQDTALALTIARYYTPSGRSLQRDYSHLDDYFLDTNKVAESDREVNYTAKGRKVLGQGGVTPDIKVEFNLLLYTAELRVRGRFLRLRPEIRRPIRRRYRARIRLPRRSPPRLGRRRGRFRSPKRSWPTPPSWKISAPISRPTASRTTRRSSTRPKSRFTARSSAKSPRVLWGVEEGWRAFEKNDPVIRKALETMPEAAKMIQ